MAKYYTRKGSKGRKMYFKDGKLITAGQYKAGMRAKARKGKIRVLRTKNSAGNFMHWEVIDGKRHLISAAAYRFRKKKDESKRKKSTRKVRKNSSKQKKNQSNAAKAMNLYHSGKADSLKEAWAMVKGKKRKTYKKRKNYEYYYSEPDALLPLFLKCLGNGSEMGRFAIPTNLAIKINMRPPEKLKEQYLPWMVKNLHKELLKLLGQKNVLKFCGWGAKETRIVKKEIQSLKKKDTKDLDELWGMSWERARKMGLLPLKRRNSATKILKLSPAQVEMLFLYHGGQTSMFYSVASQASMRKSGGQAKIRVQDIEYLENELNRAMNMASGGDLRTLKAIAKKVAAL